MKTTMPRLRRIIRSLIQEHVGDESHEHGMNSHSEEPHDGYVEGMAIAHIGERLDFEEYAAFAAEYGYTTEADLDQLEAWWEAATQQTRGGSARDGFGDDGPEFRNTTRR